MSIKSRSKENPLIQTKSSAKSKINDDEFMAAAIGDVEWLKQSIRPSKPPTINFDKNVSLPFWNLHMHNLCLIHRKQVIMQH